MSLLEVFYGASLVVLLAGAVALLAVGAILPAVLTLALSAIVGLSGAEAWDGQDRLGPFLVNLAESSE